MEKSNFISRYFIFTEAGLSELDMKEFYFQLREDDLPPFFNVLLPGVNAYCCVTQGFKFSFGHLLNLVSQAVCQLDYVEE